MSIGMDALIRAGGTRQSPVERLLGKKPTTTSQPANASTAAGASPAERLSSAERRAATAEAQLLRYEVGAAKGIPIEHVERLNGDTRLELEADAAQLLATLTGTEPAPPTSFEGGPRPTAPARHTADQELRSLIESRRHGVHVNPIHFPHPTEP